MSTFASRLREERERAGYLQETLAEAVGIGRHSQGNYEAGRRKPDAAYLASIAELGLDVLYLLTGRRAIASSDLDDDEAQLLIKFRALQPVDKRRIRAISEALAEITSGDS